MISVILKIKQKQISKIEKTNMNPKIQNKNKPNLNISTKKLH